MHLYISPMLDFLQQRITQKQGWLSFSEYMQSVLYTPGLGYYDNFQRKFGHFAVDGSDFVTAPELTPLFARTLAQTLSRTMVHNNLHQILEFGAGSGQLAIDLLIALDKQGVKVEQYAILELSNVLRTQQQQKLSTDLQTYPHLLSKVTWLSVLPQKFTGIILGNEVLDAIPIQLFIRKNQDWYERGISWHQQQNKLIWQDQKCIHPPEVLTRISGQHDYLTETHILAQAFIKTLSDVLQCGLILLIDYGFPEAEYYHPQRYQGTLMTHYRHQASIDPLFNPGLADLTTHINFSAIADAAYESNLDLVGYTSQAHFLINAGLLEQLNDINSQAINSYLPASKALQQLVSEAEMGELFKVIVFARNIEPDLQIFSRGDRSHTL